MTTVSTAVRPVPRRRLPKHATGRMRDASPNEQGTEGCRIAILPSHSQRETRLNNAFQLVPNLHLSIDLLHLNNPFVWLSCALETPRTALLKRSLCGRRSL